MTNGQSAVAGDELGISLAPLDFDGDGRVDLALGVPGRDVNGHSNAGEVVMLHNVGGRLSRSGGFVLTRDTSGMIGPGVNGERFGLLLAPGDYSANGATDLAVSLPGFTDNTETHAGAVQVFYGSPAGFQTNDQLADASDLGGVALQDASFGGVNNPAGRNGQGASLDHVQRGGVDGRSPSRRQTTRSWSRFGRPCQNSIDPAVSFQPLQKSGRGTGWPAKRGVELGDRALEHGAAVDRRVSAATPTRSADSRAAGCPSMRRPARRAPAPRDRAPARCAATRANRTPRTRGSCASWRLFAERRFV